MPPYRPAGVTALVILHIIVGVVGTITGLLLLVIFIRPVSVPSLTSLAMFMVGIPLSFGVLILGIGCAWFVFSVFSFILAYSLWTGRGWSWTLSLVLATNGLLISLLGLLLGSLANIIMLIIYGVIMVYLFTRGVRAFFGRPPVFTGVDPPSPIMSAGQFYWPQPIMKEHSYYSRIQTDPRNQLASGGVMRSCPCCRALVPQNYVICTLCGTRLR